MQKQATLTDFNDHRCPSNETKKNSFKIGANNVFENERTILRKATCAERTSLWCGYKQILNAIDPFSGGKISSVRQARVIRMTKAAVACSWCIQMMKKINKFSPSEVT